MRRPIDSIDHAILNALGEDARMPLAALAKEVNLSRNALRNRLERLERDNVISKYTILRGDGKQSREKTVALIMINRRNRMRGATMATYKLALIGFGGVGRALAALIRDRRDAVWTGPLPSQPLGRKGNGPRTARAGPVPPTTVGSGA